MIKIPPVSGRVVRSRAGRDEGNYFIVYQVISPDFVLITDGKYHKQTKPKKKRVKHLVMTQTVLEGIADKWANNKKVFDSELYSALRKYVEALEQNKSQDGR